MIESVMFENAEAATRPTTSSWEFSRSILKGAIPVELATMNNSAFCRADHGRFPTGAQKRIACLIADTRGRVTGSRGLSHPPVLDRHCRISLLKEAAPSTRSRYLSHVITEKHDARDLTCDNAFYEPCDDSFSRCLEGSLSGRETKHAIAPAVKKRNICCTLDTVVYLRYAL